VFRQEHGNACLYIKPVDDPAIWVGGTYATMTGNAKVNGSGDW
jgi:hypothetical protein